MSNVSDDFVRHVSNDFVRHVSYKSAKYYVRHCLCKTRVLHNIGHFCATRVLRSRSTCVLQSRPKHFTLSYDFVRQVSYDFVRHVSNMTLCQTFHFYPLVPIFPIICQKLSKIAGLWNLDNITRRGIGQYSKKYFKRGNVRENQRGAPTCRCNLCSYCGH